MCVLVDYVFGLIRVMLVRVCGGVCVCICNCSFVCLLCVLGVCRCSECDVCCDICWLFVFYMTLYIVE